MIIQFTKNGIYATMIGESQDEMRLLGPRFNIRLFYNHLVDIEDGLTFGELLRLLRPNSSIIDQDFIAWTKGVSIKSIFKEITKEKTEEPPFDYIEFRRMVNIDLMTHLDIENELGAYDTSVYLNAVAPKQKDKNSEDIFYYSVNLFPTNNLKDLLVYINPIAQYNCFLDSPDNEEEFDIEEDIVMADINLHDFLKCITTELTLYGTPKQRDKKAIELKKKEQDFISEPFDDGLILENLERMLKQEEENENYDVCSQLKKEIESIKQKQKIKNEKRR